MRNVHSKSLKQPFINVLEKLKWMNKFTWHCAWSNKEQTKKWKCIMDGTQIGKLFVKQGKWKLVHHFSSCSNGTILTNHNLWEWKETFVWTQKSY